MTHLRSVNKVVNNKQRAAAKAMLVTGAPSQLGRLLGAHSVPALAPFGHTARPHRCTMQHALSESTLPHQPVPVVSRSLKATQRGVVRRTDPLPPYVGHIVSNIQRIASNEITHPRIFNFHRRVMH